MHVRHVAFAVASAAALAATACATLPPGQPVAMRPAEPAEEPGAGFTRQGRIQFTPAGSPGASAAWDARYVRGPAVNMTLTDEGLWGGTLRDRAVLLRAADGRITGQGVNLFLTQDGAVTHVQGLWFGSMLRIDVSPTRLSASPTTGACGIELALADDGFWRGFGGCNGTLSYTWMTLEGVAGSMSSEMPQWLFAFLAALPSRQTTVFPQASYAAAISPAQGFLPAEFRGPAPWTTTPPTCNPWSSMTCAGWARGYQVLENVPGQADGQVVRAGGAGGAYRGTGANAATRGAVASQGSRQVHAETRGAPRSGAGMAAPAGVARAPRGGDAAGGRGGGAL